MDLLEKKRNILDNYIGEDQTVATRKDGKKRARTFFSCSFNDKNRFRSIRSALLGPVPGLGLPSLGDHDLTGMMPQRSQAQAEGSSSHRLEPQVLYPLVISYILNIAQSK